jgi:exosome complex component RRP46
VSFCRGEVLILLTLACTQQYLTLLPALLHASLLALISASVPLSMTFTASIVAVTSSGDIIRQLSVSQAASAKSLHVLAFSSKGHLLLNESQGTFDFDTWERVHEHAAAICRGTLAGSADGDVTMAEEGGEQGLEKFVRETVEDKVYRDYAWKIDAA